MHIPALPLTGCVTVVKLLNCSVPQAARLFNRANNNTDLIGLLGILQVRTELRCLGCHMHTTDTPIIIIIIIIIKDRCYSLLPSASSEKRCVRSEPPFLEAMPSVYSSR